MAKILNYGSLNIDYVYDVPHFLRPGETLKAKSRNIFAGGKGLNQSVALSKAGGQVFHAGAVGKHDSKILTDILAENHINDELLLRREGVSGHTVIEIDESGQNCILLYGGANQSISKPEIDCMLRPFASGDFLVLQNETSNIDYMIAKAWEKGLKVCFNVSPFTEELLKLPLNLCSYLIVNEIEGAAMAGLTPDADPYLMIAKLADKFKNSGLVLTLGAKGSLLKLPNEQVISCKSFKVKPLDTTAAGDTFLGFLIANLANGNEPAQSLETATAASAIAVTRKGAAPSIPSAEEVKLYLKNKSYDVIVDKL